MNWLEVSLTVNGELAEAVADVLARFAYSGVMMEQGVKYTDEEDAGTPSGPITVRAYLEINDQIEETRQKLEESLYYLGMIQPLPAASYKQIADQNWMEAWKQHYKPILIGERLVIVPAWMDSPDPNRIPIKIDPGMAFGTGTHPTTQLCLELMEKFFDDGSSNFIRSSRFRHRCGLWLGHPFHRCDQAWSKVSAGCGYRCRFHRQCSRKCRHQRNRRRTDAGSGVCSGNPGWQVYVPKSISCAGEYPCACHCASF